MTTHDPRQPIDDGDYAVLQQVRRLWEAADPPPPDLVARAQFAIELTGLDTEILKAGERREPAAARGDERTRSITFDGTRLTVIITLTPATGDTVRVDGWITPPATLPVELRTSRGTLSSTADERGRFAFDRVQRGVVQLLIHDNGTTMTPSIEV